MRLVRPSALLAGVGILSACGGGVAAATRLWREAGVRTLPGSYLCVPRPDGSDPGAAFLRLALVPDLAATTEALSRIAETFD